MVGRIAAALHNKTSLFFFMYVSVSFNFFASSINQLFNAAMHWPKIFTQTPSYDLTRRVLLRQQCAFCGSRLSQDNL
jgi:hypothetical protein